MVGHGPLKAGILVRIQVPQQKKKYRMGGFFVDKNNICYNISLGFAT